MSCGLQTGYLLLVERSGAEKGIGSWELLFYNAVLSIPFLLVVRNLLPSALSWCGLIRSTLQCEFVAALSVWASGNLLSVVLWDCVRVAGRLHDLCLSMPRQVLVTTGEVVRVMPAMAAAADAVGAQHFGLLRGSCAVMGVLLNFSLFLCTMHNSAL